jgi:hypothetical protein
MSMRLAASETFEGMARIESGERFGVKFGNETRKFNIRIGDGCNPPEAPAAGLPAR